MPLFNQKIVRSGKYVEVKRYERPQANGYTVDTTRRTYKKRKVAALREDSISRARNTLLRRVLANSKKLKPLFVTFTYERNELDRAVVLNDFKRWIRLMRQYRDLEYVYVLEPQKRGAWHIHVLIFNHCYLDIDLIRNLWQETVDEYARVNIKQTNDAKHVAFYLAKYLGKEPGSGHKRMYSCSRGLVSSEEFNYYRTYFSAYKPKKAECLFHSKYFMYDGSAVDLTIYYES